MIKDLEINVCMCTESFGPLECLTSPPSNIRWLGLYVVNLFCSVGMSICCNFVQT